MKYDNGLFHLRNVFGVSQREMAYSLGLNVTVYARYERGDRDLPLSVAKDIADKLHCPLCVVVNCRDCIFCGSFGGK